MPGWRQVSDWIQRCGLHASAASRAIPEVSLSAACEVSFRSEVGFDEHPLQALWGLSVEQLRQGKLRDRFARSLLSGEDVLDPEPLEDSASLERLTG